MEVERVLYISLAYMSLLLSQIGAVCPDAEQVKTFNPTVCNPLSKSTDNPLLKMPACFRIHAYKE